MVRFAAGVSEQAVSMQTINAHRPSRSKVRFATAFVAACAAAGVASAQIAPPPLGQPTTLALPGAAVPTAIAGLAPQLATDVDLGDVNGDGILDIVVADSANGTLNVALGTGGGAFGAPFARSIVPGSVAPTGPLGVVLADVFNNDGIAEAVVAYPGGAAAAGVRVVSNLTGPVGPGGIGINNSLPPAGFGPNNLTVFDADGDADLDVAVATIGGIQILFNIGTTLFPSLLGPTVVAAGFVPVSLAPLDADADGDLDLAVLSNSATASASLGIALNVGLGGYAAPANALVFATGLNLFGSSVAVGDFNGDAIPDVAAVGDATLGGPAFGAVEVMVSTPVVGAYNQFQLPYMLPATTLGGRRSLTFVTANAMGFTYNGDALADLIVGDDAGAFWVLRGDGIPSAPEGPFVAAAAGAGSVSMAVADLDGDGSQDLVGANSTQASAAFVGNTTALRAWAVTASACANSLVLTSTPLTFGGVYSAALTGATSGNYISLLAQFGSFPNAFPDPVSNCLLYVVPILQNVVQLDVVPSSGAFNYTLLSSVPTNLALIGAQLALQVVETTPAFVFVGFSTGAISAFGT